MVLLDPFLWLAATQAGSGNQDKLLYNNLLPKKITKSHRAIFNYLLLVFELAGFP